MTLKLAAVSMVRNECDIIELFVKINSRIFDAIYILDHMSSDGTEEIIKVLQTSGYPVKYSQLNTSQFNQDQVITNLVRQVANLDLYDYVMPIDADEFLLLEDKDSIENMVSKNAYGLIPWRTFCPISDKYFDVEAPLYDLFKMRDVEPNQFFKVFIGNEYAKNCSVSFGSHQAMSDRFIFEPKVMPVFLAHIPIRSSVQMVNKAILGSHAFRLTPRRAAGQGFHWDLMAKFIRQKDFKIEYDDMAMIALRYAISEDSLAQTPRFMLDGPRIGFSTDTIEMKNLAKINSLKSFDSFMLNMQTK